MKILRSIVFTLVILFAFNSVRAQEKVALIVPQLSLAIGEVRNIEVFIKCMTGTCAAFETTINYDPSVMEVENAELGPFLGDPTLVVANEIDNQAGSVVMAATALGEPASTETTILMGMTVKGLSSGVSPLTVSSVVIGDEGGNPLDTAAFDGSVTVSTESAAPTVSGTVNFWGYPNAGETLASIMPTLQNNFPDIDVNVEIAGITEAHERLRNALEGAEPVPDIALVHNPEITELIQTGQLENLSNPPYNASAYEGSFVEWIWKLSKSADDQVYAIPWDVAPAGFFYRRDLFEQAGLPSDPAQVAQLASTWDGFLDMCTKLTDANSNHWCIADAAEIVYSSAYIGRFFDENGRVIIDRPEVLRYVELMLQARELGIDAGVSTWDHPKWDNLIKDGSVAIQFNGSWMGGFLQTWLRPENEDWSGKWGFFPVPENPAQNRGGSLLVIPAAAQNKEAAWALIQALLLDSNTQNAMFVVSDAFPAFTPAYDDPIYLKPLDFYGGQPIREMWRDIALQTGELSVTSVDDEASALLRRGMQRILRQEVTAQEGLTLVAGEIQALLPPA